VNSELLRRVKEVYGEYPYLPWEEVFLTPDTYLLIPLVSTTSTVEIGNYPPTPLGSCVYTGVKGKNLYVEVGKGYILFFPPFLKLLKILEVEEGEEVELYVHPEFLLFRKGEMELGVKMYHSVFDTSVYPRLSDFLRGEGIRRLETWTTMRGVVRGSVFSRDSP